MKILFLNGSPRKNGYTVGVMKCIEKEIDSKHTVEWINSYDLSIKPCLSCLQCRPNKNCILPKDDGHNVWNKIRSADAIVIGSPTYFGNISGSLKILIDRNLTAFEEIAASGLEMPIPLHKGKKAIMVTACNAPFPISQLPTQSKGALQAIEIVLKAGGYNILGSITLDGAASKNKIPSEIQEQAKTLGINLQT
ncbi:flavodoxin family protein [Clostridium sp.]|uniref:flavodoxin family protein n=1 Tax=Clostridium sp. TaxID=1506 RepID=UPI00284E8679|nr:flavodoxin family protein [Clostridium sp.]MDR3594040.1 flavodoxin family protein [Clostridium sp.]